MKLKGRLTVSLIVCLALTLATGAMAQMPEQAKAPTPQTQNVNVVNTPNVNVVNTPNVTATIANTPAVVVTNQPGQVPLEICAEFTSDLCLNDNCRNFSKSGNSILFDLPAVPAGKRWIIQHISGLMPTRSDLNGYVALQDTSSVRLLGAKWAFFGPSSRTANGMSVGFSVSAYTTFGPGEVPHVNIYATDHAAGDNLFITFSGYLIDAY